MGRWLRYNALKIGFYDCFLLFLIFPAVGFSAPGSAVGACGNGISNITTVNVYASRHGAEKPVVQGGFVVTRVNNISTQVAIHYILSGSAQNSVDYQQVSGTITFAAGESEKLISISPIDDTEFEGNETITLTLSTGVGYILGNHISDTINLVDNDSESSNAQAKQPEDSKVTGNQQTHHKRYTRRLAISSSNQSNLNVGKLLAGSAIQIVNETCSNTTIIPGSHCYVDILFSPKVSTDELGILVLPRHNTTNQSIIKLNGEGGIISISGNQANVEATNQSIQFSDNNQCGATEMHWLENSSAELPAPPDGAEFISGFDFVDYRISSCEPGTTLSYTLNYLGLIPNDAKLMQYGPTPEDGSNHWYEIQTSTLSGKQAIYTLTDGQAGDHDLSANGSFIGPIGLLVPKRAQVAGPSAPGPVSNTPQIRTIPAINPIGLLLMVISLAGLARRSFISGN